MFIHFIKHIHILTQETAGLQDADDDDWETDYSGSIKGANDEEVKPSNDDDMFALWNVGFVAGQTDEV